MKHFSTFEISIFPGKYDIFAMREIPEIHPKINFEKGSN